MKRQRGFMTLDIVIGIGLMLIVIAILAWVLSRQHVSSTEQTQAINLQTLSNVLNVYETNYFTPLVNGTAIPGIANPYAPTIAELKALTIGPLNSSFSATNSFGGTYLMSVSLAPVTCTPPACDLSTLTSMSNAMINPLSKTVDTGALGAAAAYIGANAGYSTAAHPGVITFLSGAASTPNPAGNVAGVLAIRGSYGSSGMSQFTRRDGSAPPTGGI